MVSSKALVFAASLLVGSVSAFSGRATFYSVETGASQCGPTFSNSDIVVALPVAHYASGAHCGDTISVTFGSTTIHPTIIDSCPACSGDSIDLSPAAFQQLASLDTGLINVEWDFD
ncbi:hypothetical protein HGRIS_000907 [Hohenbuehelia grisea]|uniref:RlpA-like protein double-psi beta-barrel domain-containing protein n=1 Tax=Hohenbuehelia grisea TaxID=104357 RepID=A0ABR3IQ41_9AGAR